MKPLMITVTTLVTIGLGITAIELAADIGKASMLAAIRKISPETADNVMEALDVIINSNLCHGLKKRKLKIVMAMCELLSK